MNAYFATIFITFDGNMKRKFVHAVLLIICCGFFSQAQWLKEKGKVYIKLGTSHLLAREHYTSTDAVDPNATRGLWTNSVFLQFGLSNSLNIVGYVPFLVNTYQFVQVSEVTGDILLNRASLTSFGDTELGLEISLLKKDRWVLSSTVKFGIPTGNSVGLTEDDVDGTELDRISGSSYQTGDGEFNQKIELNFGTSYSLLGAPAYFKAIAGYNNRTGGFSSELHLTGETGFQALDNRLLILGAGSLLKSMKNGTLDATTAEGSFFANNLESLILRAEVAYEIIDNFGISFTYGVPVWGRLIFKAPIYSGGVYLNY